MITQILRDAKELISNPERWTQKVCARTRYAMEIDPSSDLATSWCAVGATVKASKNNSIVEAKALNYLRLATKKFGCHGSTGSPPLVNDHKPHSVVMELFDEAIRLSENHQL